MKFQTIFVFAAFSLLFSSGSRAQNTINLSDYGCFSSQIKYHSNGQEYEGVLLFVNYNDKEIPFQYSRVYLLNRENHNVLLVGDSIAFTNVYEISEKDMLIESKSFIFDPVSKQFSSKP
jgi:hypothetical protein